MKPQWRPTGSPPSSHTDMQDKYCTDCYNVFLLFKAITRTNETTKRGGAAEGRATAFGAAAAGRCLCKGFE